MDRIALIFLVIGLMIGSLFGSGYTRLFLKDTLEQSAAEVREVKAELHKAELQPVSYGLPAPVFAHPISKKLYVVKRGDTLSGLAERFCDPIPAIAKRNQIRNPHFIRAGAALAIVKQCLASEKPTQRVSPEKFAIAGGASQEKHIPEKHHPKPIRKASANCQLAAIGQNGEAAQALAIAGCLRVQYGASLKGASSETGLGENLFLAIILTESSGDHNALSPSGCKGLMQILTSTALQYGVPREMIFDPDANIRGGGRVLADYLHRYAKGDLDRALASYNLGPAKVARWMRTRGFDPSGHSYPREVKRYLRLLEADRERKS